MIKYILEHRHRHPGIYAILYILSRANHSASMPNFQGSRKAKRGFGVRDHRYRSGLHRNSCNHHRNRYGSDSCTTGCPAADEQQQQLSLELDPRHSQILSCYQPVY